MTRLLRDRYVVVDGTRVCDLVTGRDMVLPSLGGAGERGRPLASLSEALECGRDGEPRWIVIECANAAQAAAMTRRAADTAQRCGFVTMSADAYLRLRDILADDLANRTLVLVDGPAATRASARAALLEASARAPRPHVVLTITAAGTSRGDGRVGPWAVHEARAIYGAAATGKRTVPRTWPADVVRHAASIARAAELASEGRHAAAERMLRECAAALLRRQASAPAAAALVALGRLLLERGRARDADAAFADAAAQAQVAQSDEAMLAARLWQSAARCDAGRFVEAESLCRGVLVSGCPPPLSPWAHALLVRILLWQRRFGAEEIAECDRHASDAADPATCAFVDSVAVRALLQRACLFEAGQRARLAIERADVSGNLLARTIAHTAHLRMLADTGDLAHAAASFAQVAALARRAHVPLRLARARVVWLDALRRAGRPREASRQLECLARVRKVAPRVLQQAIEQRLSPGRPDAERAPSRTTSGSAHVPAAAADLVRIAHESDADAEAVRSVLERVARELQTSRLDVMSCDAGPVSSLLTIGTGLATGLGGRVLDAGIVIGPADADGGQELGVPVRWGTRLLAAIVSRWPLDRRPPAHASELLQLAAAIVAPRVDQQLAGARVVAAAATAVPELVGVGSAMVDVRRAIVRAAAAPFNVLVEGESGSGKELAARAVHQLSARRERRFCDLNCAAIPEELLDAELFGHARGAFTGAVADRAGLFEEADGGTLLLDEVADLSPRAQAKLLRVLQQQEVRRVGESFTRRIDVRLVAAANRDMRTEAAEGRFRQDLLYRLDVIRIRMPALRDRPEDIALLAEHFWRAAASRVGSSATLTHGLLAALTSYHWPGNVRELQNVMAALAVAAPSRGRVRPALLPAVIAGATAVTAVRLDDARAQFDRRCIEVALARAGGNRTRAAAQLGVTRQGLLKTMVRLGIEAK